MRQREAFHNFMPPAAPLAMPMQRFDQKPPESVPREPASARIVFFRMVVFLPVLLTTIALLTFVARLFSEGGIGWIEGVLMSLMGASFVWIALSVSTATLGLLAPKQKTLPKTGALSTLDIAVLIPIYHEPAATVMGNALAMMHHLAERHTPYRFQFYLLSDTQSRDAVQNERSCFACARAQAPRAISLFYRHREANTDRKTGNIADWICNWGGAHDAMLVLDADSLMTAGAIHALADEMSRDQKLALVQSQPKIYRGRSLLARIQQFGGHVYGPNVARGLALWSGNTANFWGHNALIRVQAFAEAAHLPKLSWFGHAPRLIMSHDFVEAALLRRRGWSVRFLPEIEGSYEEAPSNLSDFIQRDWRWCHGNLQHLRLLNVKGLSWTSRLHFLSGAFGYLLSPAWFCLLVIWMGLGPGTEANPISYFSAANPLYPVWPEQQWVSSTFVLLFIYTMLLLPKLMGGAQVLANRTRLRGHGGAGLYLISFFVELILSILYAPIMMVQQSMAVVTALLGRKPIWQPRVNDHIAWVNLATLHRVETLLGLSIFVGVANGMISWWLLPIGLSLMLAVPLSALSQSTALPGLMAEPNTLQTHPLAISAQKWQAFLHGPTHAPLAPLPAMDLARSTA